MAHLALVEQLVASANPEALKKVIVAKLIKKQVETPLSHEDCRETCQKLTDWILTSDAEYLRVAAMEGFKEMAEVSPAVFAEICTPKYVIDLFTNPRYSNGVFLITFITILLKYLPAYGNSAKPVLIRVIRTQLVHWLREHGLNLKLAVSAAWLYTLQPELLPELPQEISKLSGILVNLLASYQLPSQDVMPFVRDTDKVASILPSLWSRCSSAALEALNTVYVLISHTGETEPCKCLASVIEKMPQQLVIQASQGILDSSQSEAGEGRLVAALSRLVDWLGSWPTPQAKLLASFVMEILQKVGQERVAVLTAVTEVTIANLAQRLPLPVFREQLEPIFFFMLYGYQHSVTAFHKVVTGLPSILSNLSSQGVEASLTREKVAEAAAYLIWKHPGYPDLYAPLLKELGEVTVSEERKAGLAAKAWGGSQGDPSWDLATSSGRERGVGLINLGNTCYMNSVIQALYHTPRFRHLVVESDPVQQPVLASLQQVFLFLRYSRRNIYSPSEFLRLARPPWFETGRQQDCSEFLTYLLDTLKEEEERLVKKDEEEGRLAANTSLRSNENDARFSDQNEGEGEGVMLEEARLVVEDMETREMETVREEGEDEEDEEEARDSLGLGSLEGVKGARGSRTSLQSRGSGGLSRWSTEENLSLDGSREALNMSGSREVLMGDSSRETLNMSGSLSREEVHERLSPPKEGDQSTNGDSGDQDWLMASREQLCQTGSDSTDSGIQSVGEVQSPEDAEPAVPLSLVHRMWGGRMETSYTCLTCSATSCTSGWFTDLHLAIPSSSTSSEASTSKDPVAAPPSSTSPLTVPSLLNDYLTPERLEGENQYQCDNCKCKRDAEKKVLLTSAPAHLNITLLRFKYDRSTNRRAKVFTGVDYPHTLLLPVGDAQVSYSLFSVVVHSGYSSDGGHYYTWARNSETGAWSLLNDSLVTEQSWAQFAQMTSRTSSRDTAYLLLYQRDGAEDQGSPGPPMPLPHQLQRVEADNRNFARERSQGARMGRGTTRGEGQRKWDGGDKDDDGGSSGCSDNFGQLGGGHFIC